MYIKLLECLAVIMCFDVCCVQWLCTYVRVMPQRDIQKGPKAVPREAAVGFFLDPGGGVVIISPGIMTIPPPFPKGPGGAHNCPGEAHI